MTDFKREERYFVIKIKHLTNENYDNLFHFLHKNKVPLVEHCVVVESHWPEYEGVWKSIEDRCK